MPWQAARAAGSPRAPRVLPLCSPHRPCSTRTPSHLKPQPARTKHKRAHIWNVRTASFTPGLSFPDHGLMHVLLGLFCLRHRDRIVWLCLCSPGENPSVQPRQQFQHLFCPSVVSAASRWELCCTQAGQPATAFLFPVFSQGINVPGKGTTVPPPPGVSSFTTATWLHHPVLSFLWPLARMQLLNTITGWCTKQTAPRTLGSDLTGFVETKNSHQGQHVYLGMVLSDWSQIYLFPSLPCPAWVTSSCRILRNDCLGDVGGQRLL